MRILDNGILRIAEMELASLSELVNVAESILEKAVEPDAQDLLARYEINASIRLYTLQHPFDGSLLELTMEAIARGGGAGTPSCSQTANIN